jgi:NAD-dependent DNA ligase
VVVGADPGSKLAKAQSLGVSVLDESQFEKLVSAK